MARDPLAHKRAGLKRLMQAAKRWHADYEVTLRSLPENHLDHLLAHYGSGRLRFVY